MNACKEWFYLCLALCGTLLTALTMFFNYSLKLDARTIKLEQKNGAEQKQLNELKTKLEKLEKNNHAKPN